jgi:hypothetical protein
MARDSLLGGNIFKGLSEARGQDMRREREERERYRSRRSPSFGDILKQNLMASAASSITAPIGQAIGGAITNVIQTPFQRNAKEFESREDIIKQRRMIKDNKSSGNFLSGIQDTIKKFDGTENEFWKDYAIKRTKGRLTSELPGSGISAEDMPLYDRSMNEQARLYSEESVTYTDPSTGEKKTAPRHTRIRDAFHKARNEYEEASSQGDYDSVLKIANRRPENIIEAALGFGKRMISGQNREEYRTELDRKSFEALENSAIVRENDEFQSAFKLFKDAGDYKGLESYLNAAKADPDKSPSTQVTNTEVKVQDGILRVVHVGSITTYDAKNNITTTVPTAVKEVASIDIRTPQGKIKAADAGFNYLSIANRFLRKEVISNMSKDLANLTDTVNGKEVKTPIDFLRPKTVEEYNEIRKRINVLLQNDNNVINNEKTQVKLAAVRSIMALDEQSIARLLQRQAEYREELKNVKSDEEREKINKKLDQLYGDHAQEYFNVYNQLRTPVFNRKDN